MSKPSTFTSVFSGSLAITTTNIVQSANSFEDSPSKDKPINVSLSATKYDKFLQYQATQQSSYGNSVVCLSQTPSDTWILDSSAFDHISGNPKLFSSISNPSSLSIVTTVNGSITIAKGPTYMTNDWHMA
ncbi:Retrovirus-related Pol polyprotein from transposon TNT 1-94 [Quillaja saponaria]|uniref:Retrovirus-related Pol polyprotein from transposon TNT 1-94 n=1 Tax=Quillaja saponaria TaxID=32244 RepID=A0AAD7KZS6_QUISA|nr:Retrovirus-related Pol polyprotein from transposon TNT 1-94 [Quillaja saponaria]